LKQDQFYLTQKVGTDTPITRTDIVIYKHKTRSGSDIDYVKRIIGLPGETLVIKDGKVFINGSILIEEYATGETNIAGVDGMQESSEIIIPENHYFLMGDNRSRSDDSRVHGTISREQITKKIGACYKGCD
jgi:signal peptidase I